MQIGGGIFTGNSCPEEIKFQEINIYDNSDANAANPTIQEIKINDILSYFDPEQGSCLEQVDLMDGVPEELCNAVELSYQILIS